MFGPTGEPLGWKSGMTCGLLNELLLAFGPSLRVSQAFSARLKVECRWKSQAKSGLLNAGDPESARQEQSHLLGLRARAFAN